MGTTKSEVTRGATTSAYNGNADTDELRSEIRHTRHEMDATLEALGERLHPRHLLDDVLDWFRSADTSTTDSAKQVGSRVLDSLKEHPVPTALIGAGLAWLMVDQRKPKTYRPHLHHLGPYDDEAQFDDGLRQHAGSLVDARTEEPYDESYGQEATSMNAGAADRTSKRHTSTDSSPGMIAKAKEVISSASNTVGQKAGDAASNIAHSVSDGSQRLREGVKQIGIQSRSALQSTTGHMRSAGSSAGQRSQQTYFATRDALWEAVEDYPFAVGAAAMGLGMVLGLVVPRTRAEDELMGEASDELIEQSKATGQDLLDRGKEVAVSAADAVKGEAQKEGLSRGDLASKVQTVASDVVGAAQQSLEKQGLSPSEVKEKAKHIAGEAARTAQSQTKKHAEDLNPKR